VSEFATFVPVRTPVIPTYTEEFVASAASAALPDGTSWTITIAGASYGGVGTSINVSGLAAGMYTATVSDATASGGLTKWTPTSASLSVQVTGDGQEPVAFGAPSFWVSISGTTGGTVAPASGWYADHAAVTLTASPNLGETFVNWSGTGLGSYTGNGSSGNATANAPLTEFATFQPMAPAAVTVSSTWTSTSTLALLAIAGLIVGLVVGLVVRRARTAPVGGSDPATGPVRSLAPSAHGARSTPTGGMP
jgi:hypothetical protein